MIRTYGGTGGAKAPSRKKKPKPTPTATVGKPQILPRRKPKPHPKLKPIPQNNIRKPKPAPKRKKAPVKPKPTPVAFDPLASPYKTQADFDAAVKSGALGKIQPELDSVASQSRLEDRLHAGQNQEIGQVTNWYADRLKGSANDASAAIQQVLSANSGASADSLAALGAAIRTAMGGQEALAGQVQTAPVDTGNTEASLGAARAAQGADQTGLANTGQGLIAMAQARQGLAGAEQSFYGSQERGRHVSTAQELSNQERDIRARLPGLETDTRKEYQDAELNRASTRQQLDLAKKQFGEQVANQKFQQWLATKEFNLKDKNQTFQEYLAKENLKLDKSKTAHASAIDWANVRINRAQVDAQAAQYQDAADKETDAAKKEALQTKATAVANARDWLATYLLPGKGEAAPHVEAKKGKTKVGTGKNAKTVYRRYFDEAYRNLRSYGLTPAMAYKMLTTVQFASWRKKAKNNLAYYSGKNPKLGPAPQETP